MLSFRDACERDRRGMTMTAVAVTQCGRSGSAAVTATFSRVLSNRAVSPAWTVRQCALRSLAVADQWDNDGHPACEGGHCRHWGAGATPARGGRARGRWPWWSCGCCASRGPWAVAWQHQPGATAAAFGPANWPCRGDPWSACGATAACRGDCGGSRASRAPCRNWRHWPCQRVLRWRAWRQCQRQ